MLIKLVVLFAITVPTQALGQELGYDEQGCIDTDAMFETGHGCWVYHDTGANTNKPVRVWYYYPTNFDWGSRKVVFAMHGSGRNAGGALNRWRTYADEHGALIIAPEFNKEHYPEGRDYNRGNVRDNNGNMRSRADWTFTTIEEIFDVVREEIPEAPQRYSIQGHSAGGQFVHRMVLLGSDYRIDTAVAANPGWYLLPDEDYNYPCGIRNLQGQYVDLAAAYKMKLVITLGTEDNDPNAPLLNHGDCAEMQGSNRYDRGRFFHTFAKNDALNRGLPFTWKLVEVPGVGHNANGMVEAGADEILGAPAETQALTLNPTQDATVKANYPTSNYGRRDTLQVDGRSVKTAYMKFDLSEVSEVSRAVLRVNVTDPSSGVQRIHEAAHNQWSENDLTYNNQPGTSSLVTTINGASRGGLSIDLTEFIRDRLGRIITIVLSSSDRNGLYFESREATTPPKLELYH
jgi:hypothetical protein